MEELIPPFLLLMAIVAAGMLLVLTAPITLMAVGVAELVLVSFRRDFRGRARAKPFSQRLIRLSLVQDRFEVKLDPSAVEALRDRSHPMAWSGVAGATAGMLPLILILRFHPWPYEDMLSEAWIACAIVGVIASIAASIFWGVKAHNFIIQDDDADALRGLVDQITDKLATSIEIDAIASVNRALAAELGVHVNNDWHEAVLRGLLARGDGLAFRLDAIDEAFERHRAFLAMQQRELLSITAKAGERLNAYSVNLREICVARDRRAWRAVVGTWDRVNVDFRQGQERLDELASPAKPQIPPLLAQVVTSQ